MQNKNPADTGGTEKLPGYPQDKNPAGTPDPRPEEFPGKKSRDVKEAGKEQRTPERRDADRGDPDVNEARRRDERPARGDVERSGGDTRGRETNRNQKRQ
jgi:hypothetical protein